MTKSPVYESDTGIKYEVEGVLGRWFVSIRGSGTSAAMLSHKTYSRKRDAIDALVNHAEAHNMKVVEG
jgi:hypothetical protein